MYYASYLELDKILSAQHPQSTTKSTLPSHDEMLFIIVHQAYELWFKQILHELRFVNDVLQEDNIDDNSEEMALAIDRLDRVKRIIKLLIGQMDVLDTMQPIDFLEFRGLLTPASGFQSTQFRQIEAMLGLRMEDRHNKEHYKNTEVHSGGFKAEDHQTITETEQAPTILSGLKQWLDRMPFLNEEYLEDYVSSTHANHHLRAKADAVMVDYLFAYEEIQAEARDVKINGLYRKKVLGEDTKDDVKKITDSFHNSMHIFDKTFMADGSGPFSAKEMRAALFITSYRHMPMLRLPFELISSVTEIDELFSSWRYRHFQIAMKMIGNKPGTGGSAGAEYLLGALAKNKVFHDLAVLPTYYLRRDQLPILGDKLTSFLTFKQPITA